MSGQHTQGRITAHGASITFDNSETGLDIEKSHANARRLAACWNAFDGVRTDMVEAAAQTGGMERACNALSELPAIEANYEAARALLSEVSGVKVGADFRALEDRIRAFLKGKKP